MTDYLRLQNTLINIDTEKLFLSEIGKQVLDFIMHDRESINSLYLYS